MTEFKIYHFNWTANPVKQELLKKLNSFSEEAFDTVVAKTEAAAVKYYIKEHGLPSNDSALIGVKTDLSAKLFIAKTNKNRTCAVQALA